MTPPDPHDPSDPNSAKPSRGVPSEAIAAGLILAALAVGFVLAPRAVAWADGVSPGLGFWMAVLLAVLLGGGFVAVFWLRGRSRRKG